MHAAVIYAYGEPPRLGQLPDPTPGLGTALVRVDAAVINQFDLNVASGQFHTGAPTLPYIPGIEGAGVVVQSDTFPSGARVRFDADAGYSEQGSFAELAVVEDDALYPIPDPVSSHAALAIGNSGLTAYLALEQVAQLAPDETVVVLGATGVAGQYAVQAARVLGAGRVVAAGRNDQVLQSMLRVGAHATVNLATTPTHELTDAIREAANGNVDVIFDSLWGDAALAAMRAAAAGARLVQIGDALAPTAQIPSRILRGKRLSILGYANRQVPRPIRKRAYEILLSHAAAGDIIASYELLPFDQVSDVWSWQQRGVRTRLVLAWRHDSHNSA